MYLDADEALSPHKQQERLILERETLTQDVLASVKDDMTGRFILTPILRWMLNQSQLLTRERDTMHFEMTRLFPPFRVFLLELGSRWAARGLIEQNEDIFFLEIEELEELADRPRVVRELVQQRRHEFDLNEEQGSPTIILEGEPIYPERSAEQDEDPNVLRGISGSPGQFEGVARIIRGPEEFSKLQRGEILIAPLTNPVWTPLFAIASAVVTEIGGILSHGAIVAREYGIPAVMSAAGATARLTDGQIITVDGNKGVVYIPETEGVL
jgi:pyruvate,water dikinase